MGIVRHERSRAALPHWRHRVALLPGALRCREKFLRFFPRGFQDPGYYDWERGYKWRAHEQWIEFLNRNTYRSMLRQGNFREIADLAVRIESRTNLLFSFEKMALRDAVRPARGAQIFAQGLFAFLHSEGELAELFARWCETIAALPHKQSRVLTWPVLTVFGFIAEPERHNFLKPKVTKAAAAEYGFDFHYESRPSIETYESLLEFAKVLVHDLRDLEPRDMIDIQSFIWVQGSEEFAE